MDEQEKQLRELAELQKKTDPIGFRMVLDLARDCAELLPAKTPHLRLVVGGGRLE